MTSDPGGTKASVSNAAALTPQDEALLDAGKAMLVNSIDVGRSLCTTMITLCTAALGAHATLIALAAGKEFDFDLGSGVIALIGPVLYMAAICVFVVAYFPKRGQLSLESLDSIEQTRESTILHRQNWSIAGTVLFVFGLVATIGGSMYFFTY
jgi:hypothetical protein